METRKTLSSLLNCLYFGFPAEDEPNDEEMSDDVEENIPGRRVLKFHWRSLSESLLHTIFINGPGALQIFCLVRFSKKFMLSHYQTLQNMLFWDVSAFFNFTAAKLWLIQI